MFSESTGEQLEESSFVGCWTESQSKALVLTGDEGLLLLLVLSQGVEGVMAVADGGGDSLLRASNVVDSCDIFGCVGMEAQVRLSASLQVGSC